MKKLFNTLLVALVLAGCNNAPKTEEKPAEVATPVETKPEPPAFKPYTARYVELTVKDFAKWETEMMKDTLPSAYGLTNPGIGRIADNDKKVIVLSDVADLAKAKQYDASPARAKNLKSANAVAGTPSYWNVIMDDTSALDIKDRFMVTAKVKDFAAWKKGFDAEGMATRKSFGFYERAMAQSVDDPNTITLIFAVTDAARVKTRMASEEFKKMIEEQGVIGTPKPTFFKWVNQ